MGRKGPLTNSHTGASNALISSGICSSLNSRSKDVASWPSRISWELLRALARSVGVDEEGHSAVGEVGPRFRKEMGGEVPYE